MDYYIRKTSYVIRGGYYCYQKQFIKSFSIPRFSEQEASKLLAESDKDKIDDFLVRKYALEL
jgi:adenine-specific DNA-methyltransferase